jgi:hypothetical protein
MFTHGFAELIALQITLRFGQLLAIKFCERQLDFLWCFGYQAQVSGEK